MSRVTFRVYDVSAASDCCVILVGSCGELGDWNPEHGVRLSRVDSNASEWTAMVRFNDESETLQTVYYKYVVCTSSGDGRIGDVTWEDGGNHSVDVVDGMEVRDCWTRREESQWKMAAKNDVNAGESTPKVVGDGRQRSLRLLDEPAPANTAEDTLVALPSSPLLANQVLDPAYDGDISPCTGDYIPSHPLPKFNRDSFKGWDFPLAAGEPPKQTVMRHVLFASDNDFVTRALKCLADGLRWFVGEALANPPHHLNFVENAKKARLRADAFKASHPDPAIYSPPVLLDYLLKEKSLFLKPDDIMQAHQRLRNLSVAPRWQALPEDQSVENVLKDASQLLQHVASVSYKNGHRPSDAVSDAIKCASVNIDHLKTAYSSLQACKKRAADLNALPSEEKRRSATICIFQVVEHLSSEDNLVDAIIDILACRQTADSM